MIGSQLGSFAAGEDIEELASDVFVALWRASQSLRTEHLRGWLGKVARNQAISFLRRQHLQLVRQDIDFTQDGAVTFDTDGKTDGFLCGISQIPQQANGIDAGLTSTLYESLSYADQYEGQHFLSSLSDEEKQQTKELITRINYHDKVGDDDCSVECLSVNDVAGVDLLLWGHDTQLIKEGTINGLYAAWVENTTDPPAPDGNGRISVKQQYLFLYDPDKLCVVVLWGKWETCEALAAELTIVQTDIPTPERDRDFIWVGALG